MKIEGLRSPYEKIGGLYYFGRMIDKIRLHAQGALPEEYIANLGRGFDLRCLNFLGLEYEALARRVQEGGTDEAILQWSFAQGRPPKECEVEIWNAFMRKFGWNDEAAPTLQRRLAEGGFSARRDIQTIFDYIDLDEGRDPAEKRSDA